MWWVKIEEIWNKKELRKKNYKIVNCLNSPISVGSGPPKELVRKYLKENRFSKKNKEKSNQ